LRHHKLIINDDSHPNFFLSYINPICPSFFIKSIFLNFHFWKKSQLLLWEFAPSVYYSLTKLTKSFLSSPLVLKPNSNFWEFPSFSFFYCGPINLHPEIYFFTSIWYSFRVELVSKELNHFGVIAGLFRQIGGHNSRFCSFWRLFTIKMKV